MKNDKNQQGYILVLSLIFISLIVMLATSISFRGRIHTNYAKLMLDREHAKMLAFSGLQIAMTQLAIQEEQKKGAKAPEKKQQGQTLRQGAKAPAQDERKKEGQSGKTSALWTEKESKEFVKHIFPVLNNWQEFKLTTGKYGVDGVVKICIGSEEGKIDLNQVFDFDKKKFVGQGQKEGDFKKFFAELFKKMGKFIKVKELQKNFEAYLTKKQRFEKILKNRQNRLYDTTEFLDQKGFESFADKVFYEPIEMKKGVTKKPKPNIYWTDMFTIWSGAKKISPWFISTSLKRILGFKEEKVDQKKAERLAKNFKASVSFPGDWDKLFAPIFGVKHKDLPKWFAPLLDTKFGPKVFNVLSYGTAGKVTQKIFAIIERKKVTRDKKTVVEFEIKKFYWI